jgi:hypothetical protein
MMNTMDHMDGERKFMLLISALMNTATFDQ